MRTSLEDQIKDIKKTIEQFEICKAHADTRAQQESDQRKIDALNVQLKELQDES